MSNYLSDDKRAAILKYGAEGMSRRQICRTVGAAIDTVCKVLGPTGRIWASGPPSSRKSVVYPRPVCNPSLPGTCGCGCGSPLKGGYNKSLWVQGHYQKATAKLMDPQSAAKQEKRRVCNELRREMVATFYQDRFVTRCMILDRFDDRGYDRMNLSKIFINGLRDLSYGLNKEGIAVPVRGSPKRVRKSVYRAAVAPYERKPIPYENKTDIKYLTRNGRFRSLDAPVSIKEDPTNGLHDVVRCDGLDPAEILMLKEEAIYERAVACRRDQFSRWDEANRPLQSLSRHLDVALAK